jgi:tetratricopeptide (TPR) repeat protein
MMLVLTEPSAIPQKPASARRRRTREDLLKEASSHCSKGCSEWKSGNSETALQEFTSALRIMENVLGTFHLLTAKTYFWIGFILQKSGSSEYQKCLEAFSQTLRIRLQLSGSDHKTTKEARQSARWAFQKIFPDSKDDANLFVDALERSQEYEHQGDDLLKSHDISAALDRYHRAIALYERVHPPPQILGKCASCYSSLQNPRQALYWYRKTLFGFWTSSIYQHQHPGIEATWNQMTHLLPPESTFEYVKMVEESMKHQFEQQQDTGLASQYHLLQAANLELQFAEQPNPVVRDLIDKIDVHVIRNDLKQQVQVAANGVLAEALVFDRKNQTTTSERLRRLETFQDRATICLRVLENASADDRCMQPPSQPLTSWISSPEVWLTRQIHAVELSLAYISHRNRLMNEDVDGRLSYENRIETLTQELASLSVKLMGVQKSLHEGASAESDARRQSSLSRMAELHQDIAFREARLELIQKHMSLSKREPHQQCGKQDEVNNFSICDVKCLRECLAQAQADLNMEKKMKPNMSGDTNTAIHDHIRIWGTSEEMESTLDTLVSPVKQISLRVGLWDDDTISVVSKREAVTKSPITSDTNSTDSQPSNNKELLRKSKECIRKLQARLEMASEEIEDLTKVKAEQFAKLQSIESAFCEINEKREATEGKLRQALETNLEIMDRLDHMQRVDEGPNETSLHSLRNAMREEHESLIVSCQTAKDRLDQTIHQVEKLNEDGNCIAIMKRGVGLVGFEGRAQHSSKNDLEHAESTGVAILKTAIEQSSNVFKSRSAHYTMRMPILDSKKIVVNLTDPTTIQVMVRITFDGSLLSLSADSQAHHRLFNGTWKDLGCAECREEPFGWISYGKKSGKKECNYSLGTCL